MLKTLAATTLMAAMLVGPAAAQDTGGAAVVAAQLNSVATDMGLTPGGRVTGRLANERSRIANLEAPGGQAYFIGVCDGNCRDLDLIVRDASGREVGRDFEPDDVPVVMIQATAGVYTVEVSMADCTGECHWGVGVFR